MDVIHDSSWWQWWVTPLCQSVRCGRGHHASTLLSLSQKNPSSSLSVMRELRSIDQPRWYSSIPRIYVRLQWRVLATGLFGARSSAQCSATDKPIRARECRTRLLYLIHQTLGKDIFRLEQNFCEMLHSQKNTRWQSMVDPRFIKSMS